MKIPQNIEKMDEYTHNAKWKMAQKIIQLLVDDEYTLEEAECVIRYLPTALNERRVI